MQRPGVELLLLAYRRGSTAGTRCGTLRGPPAASPDVQWVQPSRSQRLLRLALHSGPGEVTPAYLRG